jgi:antirestriction protein ArdC
MAQKKYPKKSPEELQKEIKDLMTNAIPQIRMDSMSPKDRLEFLNFMATQHNYSIRNTALIRSQYENALYVAPYKTWSDKGLHVKRGEHGLKILVPVSYKRYLDDEAKAFVSYTKLSAGTKAKVNAKDPSVPTQSGTYFSLGSVFDITQTNAKAADYPKIFPNRPFEFPDEHPEAIDRLIAALRDEASHLGAPVTNSTTTRFPTITGKLGAAKGAAISTPEGLPVEIFMKQGLGKEEYAATLVHEIAHVRLHNAESKDVSKFWDTHDVLSETYRGIKELQAEMTSYVVCKSMGINTFERAKPYIAGWTDQFTTVDGAPEQQQAAIMNDIQRGANAIINDVSASMEKSQDHHQEQSQEQEHVQPAQHENKPVKVKPSAQATMGR